MSGSRPGVRAPYWRLRRDQARIVMRAPIPMVRKAVLLTQLARTMRLQWRRLYRELLDLRRA